MSDACQPKPVCMICGAPANQHFTDVVQGDVPKMASGSFCDAHASRASEVLKPDEATYRAHEALMRTEPWASRMAAVKRRMARMTQAHNEIVGRAGVGASSRKRILGADDVALAMFQKSGCAALAVLRRLNVDLDRVRESALHAVGSNIGTPESAAAIKMARSLTMGADAEADALQDAHIGSEHLLICAFDCGGNVLRTALDEAGITREALIAAIRATTGRRELG